MNLVWVKALDPLVPHPSLGRVGYYWLLSFHVECDSKVNFFFDFKLLLYVDAVNYYTLLVHRIVEVLFAKHLVRCLAHIYHCLYCLNSTTEAVAEDAICSTVAFHLRLYNKVCMIASKSASNIERLLLAKGDLTLGNGNPIFMDQLG